MHKPSISSLTDLAVCAGLDMIAEIAECIGGHSLASVCRLLAEDHAGWSGGSHLLHPLGCLTEPLVGAFEARKTSWWSPGSYLVSFAHGKAAEWAQQDLGVHAYALAQT